MKDLEGENYFTFVLMLLPKLNEHSKFNNAL